MGKKKKPFIDKKTAHSFQVVHRSQKDPLQADEDSSKRVLVPIDSVAQACADQVEKSETSISKVEQQLEYGIHFEDEYDYMQHLKTRTDCTLEPLPSNVTVIENKNVTKEFGNVKLPSEVFASGYEQEEGLLNLAAPAPGPHPEWDPDIVAALDDDLDLDEDSNILDDDFIFKANAPSNEAADEDESDDDDLIRSDKEFDDNDDEKYFPLDGEADDDSHGGLSFDDEETKSRFTSYSMTSSVIRRNKGLTMLDDKFEKVMEEYDEDEIGALDHEEVLGTVDTNADSHIINAITEEFEQTRTKVHFSGLPLEGKGNGSKSNRTEQSSGEDDEDLVRGAEKPKEQWDCESILSTYSNHYNHPTLIREPPSKTKTIKLSKKTGIPIGVLPARPSWKEINQPDHLKQMEVLVGPKPRNEDKEQKRLRKKAVKEERRQRRSEKKSNKMAFKAESKRQEVSMLFSKQQQSLKL